MKKISGVKAAVVMVLLAGMVAALAGCASADSVAIKYFEAIAEGDVEAIEAVASPEIAQFFATNEGAVRAFQEKLNSYGEMTFRRVEGSGDTAVVTISWEKGRETVNLKKVDGEWKVYLPPLE